MDIERRYYPATEIRVQAEEGSTSRLTGYAAVFNSPSEDLGGFREIILPGAFAEAIERDDVRALWNHDPNYVLGRNLSGTLALTEDKHGLGIAVTPPDTQWARDLMVSIERGDVSQMSFGFSVSSQDEKWEQQNGEHVRYLVKVRLFDISPVTYPAYPSTEVQARTILDNALKRNLIPTEPMPEGNSSTTAPTRSIALTRKQFETLSLRRRHHAS